MRTDTATKNWSNLRKDRAKHIPDFQGRVDDARLRADLAQFVYDLRSQAGITQAQLARRMGTTQSAIARLEGGGMNPSAELLHKLGNALAVRLMLTADSGADFPGASVTINETLTERLAA
ncbi:MAG: transcriptional regulator [Acidimicrobiales bacterium]|nr:MAG: transcriptional regulator [Acidimicrobiales bacterium]